MSYDSNFTTDDNVGFRFCQQDLYVFLLTRSCFLSFPHQTLAAEEKKRQQKDIDLRETAEAKNAVEAYVYDTRSALNDGLHPYVLEAVSTPLPHKDK